MYIEQCWSYTNVYLFKVSEQPMDREPFASVVPGQFEEYDGVSNYRIFVGRDGSKREIPYAGNGYKCYDKKREAYEEYKEALMKNKDILWDMYTDNETRDEDELSRIFAQYNLFSEEIVRVDALLKHNKLIEKRDFKNYEGKLIYGSMYWIDVNNKVIRFNAIPGRLKKENHRYFFYDEKKEIKYETSHMLLSSDPTVLKQEYRDLAINAQKEVNRRIEQLNKINSMTEQDIMQSWY